MILLTATPAGYRHFRAMHWNNSLSEACANSSRNSIVAAFIARPLHAAVTAACCRVSFLPILKPGCQIPTSRR